MPGRKSRRAANTPPPSGPIGGLTEEMNNSVCGHSKCGRVCNVRYCGPTSPIRDHHIVHAARGVAHVWTAAIVAGLAIVLTGAIAYTAIEAQSATVSPTQTELNAINQKLDSLEKIVTKLSQQCDQSCKSSTTTISSQSELPLSPVVVTSTNKQAPQVNYEETTCLKKCASSLTSCLKQAGDNTSNKDECNKKNAECQTTCSK